jgi:RNA polymerase sigma-70 factor (ECF subfamily)
VRAVLDGSIARETLPGRDDASLVVALREGDEEAFLALVERHHRSMIRVARAYVGAEAAAEDVAQEAWLGVVKGIERFEGRCSVKSWLFRIVVYLAKARRAREARVVPLSALEDDGPDEPAVDPDRFQPASSPFANNWSRPPERWADERLASAEAARLVRLEIERLPANQRAVITLRDVEGLEAGEVCAALGLSEGNQRVLLHRARARVRAGLEAVFHGEGRP